MTIVAELVKVSATLVYSYTNQRSRDCIPFILFHSKDYFTVVSLDLLVSSRPDHTYFIFLPQSIMLYYNESLWRLLSYIYIFTLSISPNCWAETWRRCTGNLQQQWNVLNRTDEHKYYYFRFRNVSLDICWDRRTIIKLTTQEVAGSIPVWGSEIVFLSRELDDRSSISVNITFAIRSHTSRKVKVGPIRIQI